MGQDDQVGQGAAADVKAGDVTPSDVKTGDSTFAKLQAQDIATEKRIFWSELAVFAVMAFLLSAYFIFS